MVDREKDAERRESADATTNPYASPCTSATPSQDRLEHRKRSRPFRVILLWVIYFVAAQCLLCFIVPIAIIIQEEGRGKGTLASLQEFLQWASTDPMGVIRSLAPCAAMVLLITLPIEICGYIVGVRIRKKQERAST